MLWLFRLSVDSEDPGEERWEQIRQRDSRKYVPTALKTAKTTKIILPLEVQLIRRGAEQKGKPTYRSYSSIPIEHSSGPRAAQRGGMKRQDGRKQKGSVRKTDEPESTQVRCKAQNRSAEFG